MADNKQIKAKEVTVEQVKDVLDKAIELWYGYDLNPDSVVNAMLYMKVDELVSLLRQNR